MILDGDHVVYLDQVEGSRSVRMFTVVGTARSPTRLLAALLIEHSGQISEALGYRPATAVPASAAG